MTTYNGTEIDEALEQRRWNAAHDPSTTSTQWRELFCDTGYTHAAAQDKRAFFDVFTAWLAADCPREQWMTDTRMYDALYVSLFGHVAEFGPHGFYGAWFETPQARAHWVEYALRGGAYGIASIERSDMWTDVERAIVAWLNESGTAARLIAEGQSDTERQEREQLRALLAKYPDER